MRITNIGPTNTDAIRKKNKAGAAGDFAALMGTEETEEAAPAAPAMPVNAMGGLLAAQMVDPDEPRKRQLNHGKDLLAYLDELRLGILSGGISAATVQRLVNEARTEVGEVVDPQLAEVLRDIETRAAVELAKLEKSLPK